MTAHSKTRLAATWALLLCLSVTAVLVARHAGSNVAGLGVVLVLALVKCRLILLDFLGLMDASPLLRRALFGWCLALAMLALAKIWMLAAAS
ncbi:MAG: cytochrome C oxidase subunit IV family protein [Allorhizobium sp.]